MNKLHPPIPCNSNLLIVFILSCGNFDWLPLGCKEFQKYFGFGKGVVVEGQPTEVLAKLAPDRSRPSAESHYVHLQKRCNFVVV